VKNDNKYGKKYWRSPPPRRCSGSGRFSLRSRASPRAASALCRGYTAGSGRHRALARPPVAPNARQEKSILSNCLARAGRNPQTTCKAAPFNFSLVTFHFELIPISSRSWVPPQQCMVSQLLCQGGHPGGGVPQDPAVPRDEEAWGQGDTSPTNYLFFSFAPLLFSTSELLNFSTIP
jgi:hypothetical protein